MGKKTIKRFDFLILIVLLLYLTELFRIVLLAKIPLNYFAILITVLLLTYVVKNYNLIKKYFSDKTFLYWSFIIFFLGLLLLPLHIVMGHASSDLIPRALGNSFLYLLIFYSSFILSYKYGFELIKRKLIYPSLILIISGLLYNYINPSFFIRLKLLLLGNELKLDADSIQQIERVGGFYLKSTYAAFSMLPILFFSFLSSKDRNLLSIVLITIVIIFLIFITGSRSALIFLVFSFYFIGTTIFKTLKGRYKVKPNQAFESVVILIPAIFLALFIILYSFSLYLSSQGYTIIGDRILSLTSASNIENDNSVNQRFEAQKKYLNFIEENPLIGYGPTLVSKLQANDTFGSSSHNSYIEYTFNYGVLFLILFIVFIVNLLYSKKRKFIYKNYQFDYLGFFAIFLLVCSMFNNTMLENKPLIIMLGIAIGISIKRNENDNICK